jgi:hypothetical protein
MKIEHWHSRSRYGAEQLAYSNLREFPATVRDIA